MWQLSGIRLILPWLCSLRLSILRRLEHVFVSAWGWCVSTLQKSLRLCFRFCFCLLICSLVSGIRPVFAQSTSVIVSDISGDCSYLNGTYSYVDQINGKSHYGKQGNNIYWNEDEWLITNASAVQLYQSNEYVSEPFLVSMWNERSVCGSSVSVYQPVQPTTTPTFHPLFPTSTPPAPGDYTCPGYQPIGAGTVTPAVDWLLKCAQCITPIPRYTWPTIPAFATPDGSIFGTPTPVGTSTPSPLGKMTVYMDVGVALPHPEPNTIVTHNSILKRSFGTTFWENWSDPWILPKTIGIHFWGSQTITRTTGGVATISVNLSSIGQHNLDLEVMESNVTGLVVGTTYRLAANNGYKNTVVLTIGSTWTSTYSWDVTFNVTLLDHGSTFQEFFRFYIEPGGGYNALTTIYNMEYQLNNWTGLITSDCSTVPVQPMDDPNDPNFKLPYVSVGDGVSTTVGGWHISTSWLQVFFPNAPDSVTFPGIEFVFAPIEFGSLNLFGISIDLDFMALAMAGVLMFKVITR